MAASVATSRVTRAIAQTNMTINERATVDGVLVDVVCTGRMYDFIQKYQWARWVIRRRQPIYEKDRMDPVDPSATLKLDPAVLASFPEGYRHLGYLQSKIGFPVRKGLPGLKGASVEKIYAGKKGKAWLGGSEKPGIQSGIKQEHKRGARYFLVLLAPLVLLLSFPE